MTYFLKRSLPKTEDIAELQKIVQSIIEKQEKKMFAQVVSQPISQVDSE